MPRVTKKKQRTARAAQGTVVALAMCSNLRMAADKLRHAECEMDWALGELAAKGRRCGECGLLEYAEHGHLAEQLRGALVRCRQVREQIERETGDA